MISFRYHLVTIVAVFLALGLGLLGGTTVVDEGLVQRLKDQTSSANQRAEQLQSSNDELTSSLGRSTQFASDVVPGMEQGRLAGENVILITTTDTDVAVIKQTEQALKDAGAQVVTVLSVTPRMTSPDPAARQQLAEILGVDASTPGGTMSKEAATRLATRLATGSTAETDKPPGDVLLQLLDGGFLVSDPTIKVADLPTVGGDGQVIVLVAGGQNAPAVPPDDFMIPVAQGLVKQNATVAAGETAASSYDFVGPLRDDGTADGKTMVTVDNADEPVGGLAMVLGLRDLLLSGQGGNFGFKRGAGDLYPPLSG